MWLCVATQGDLLDVINSWDEARRAAAYAVIAEIEAEALLNMKLMPGLDQLCRLLDAKGVTHRLTD